MDWKAIKTEYITTDTSYRKLAKKHGVSFNTLQQRATKEEWVKLRCQTQDRVLSKSIAAFENKQAGRATKIIDMANKLLEKMAESIDSLDPTDRQGFRQLTAALKDIKDIQMVKSEADIREQEARIANLQKHAQADDDNKDIVVRIVDDAEEYSQ